MEDIGLLTKQLLSNRNNQIQMYDQTKNNIRNNIRNQLYSSDTDEIYSDADEKNQLTDENMFDTNFGDISYIQIPYEMPEQSYSYEDDDTIKNNTEENFCSYVLYFIIILICLGYIGYHLGSEKVISIESMNGITMGLLSGLIIVNLLWSSIKNN
jgi:small-conductance mechanosensitive channel